MKTQFTTNKRRGFTLIELLVVIAIIAILAALGGGAAVKAIAKARETTAYKTCQDLERGVSLFYDEYNRYPVEGAGTEVETKNSSASGIISTLIGKNETLNPKNLSFFNSADAKSKKGGIIWEGNSPSLVDPWGRTYYVKFDDNFDDEIEPPTGVTVSGGVIRGRRSIAWTYGADGANDTSKQRRDNVYSFQN